VAAEAECRKALVLRPDYFRAYSNLGSALQAQKKFRQAEEACREAIRLEPGNASAHNNLGTALGAQGRLDEAVAAFRRAIEIDQNLALAHYNLGNALRRQGRFVEAEAACRKAIDLKKGFAQAHYQLGIALHEQKKLDEAEEALRQAISCNPNYAEARCDLGRLLGQQGRFAEALAEIKLGHELGARQPNWPHPSGQWLRMAKQFAKRETKLAQILGGRARPADAAECLELALMCQKYKQLYAAALHFYEEAFAAQPGLANDLQKQYRYDAACMAALAAAGQGRDAKALPDQERARLREQARTWLRDDLKACRQQLDKDPAKARPLVAQRMRHWQDDTDFAGVRGKEALGRLPEAEHQEWQKLWEDVAALRQRAAEPPKPGNVGRP
jgi:tetratricopeptide (TPR) repeat protein